MRLGRGGVSNGKWNRRYAAFNSIGSGPNELNGDSIRLSADNQIGERGNVGRVQPELGSAVS